jgi:hypothetical protein
MECGLEAPSEGFLKNGFFVTMKVQIEGDLLLVN